MQIRVIFSGTGVAVPIQTKTRMARGIAAAAIRYSWLRGNNLPRTPTAMRRAAYAALHQKKS